MKIELTQLQAEKTIEAVRTKFNDTHDASWLGLLHNLESQVNWKEHKKPYVLDWLKDNFKPVTINDAFGRQIECQPQFEMVGTMKPKDSTATQSFGGTIFRYKQWGYMPQTKDYQISYAILK